MNPERSIEVKGKSYPVAFTTNAQFQLTQYLRQNNLGTLGEFVARMILKKAEIFEIQLFLWACLEGARLRTFWRPLPFSIYEAGELIDAAGGLGEIAKQIEAAIEAASPKAKDGDSKNESPAGEEKKSTGTRSSKKQQKLA